jgi:hypothetical protein
VLHSFGSPHFEVTEGSLSSLHQQLVKLAVGYCGKHAMRHDSEKNQLVGSGGPHLATLTLRPSKYRVAQHIMWLKRKHR